MPRDPHKLKAYELADKLCLAVYRETRRFPVDERPGVTAQMRGAAFDAVANILEGCAGQTKSAFLEFLDEAAAHLRSLGYLIDLSRRLDYLDAERARILTEHHESASKVLAGLIRSLKKG